MTHIEFEHHFADQAERFGIAKIIRQRGEEYAFQSFMLVLSGIVARNESKPIDEEKLDRLAEEYVDNSVAKSHIKSIPFEAFKAGYRKAKEEIDNETNL